MSNPKRVLVTGATGFLGKHCVLALLEAGYKVRGTVRRATGGKAVRRALERHVSDAGTLAADRLDFAIADLTSDAGWDAAMDGCSQVLHVASPFPMAQPRNRDELIVPARDGALRALRAASKAGVRRVVMTSSIVAIVYGNDKPPNSTYSEADWTDHDHPQVSAYIASKTIAERAAWDFVKTEAPGLELTVVNPGLVLGPTLDHDLSTSIELIVQMAKGAYPAAPRAGYAIVDARDVAAMHVLAMTHPAAAGERFLCTAGFMMFKDIGAEVAKVLPDRRWRVPQFHAQSFAVRGLSHLFSSFKQVVPDLDNKRICDNAKACERLGFTFRSPAEAAAASARSLRDLGLI